MKGVSRRLDYPLLFVAVILALFGLVMIFSASSITAVLLYKQSEYYFFLKQAIVLLLTIPIFLVIIHLPIKLYKYIGWLLMAIAIGVLVLLRLYGTVTNSAQSWFRIFGVSVQPSEFAKTFMIIFLASSYGFKKKIKNVYELFLPLIPCVIVFGLVASEPDLGTAIIIALICVFIFFSLPVGKSKIMLAMKVLFFIGIIAVIFGYSFGMQFLTENQQSRLQFLNPCDRYQEESGYQVCNGYIAMNNGGLLGSGLGKSTQKYLYLPEAHTDFIFPIIVEELGVIGGGAVLLLYVILLYRVLAIARNAEDLAGSIIAFGTFSYILIHIAVNLCGVLALIPLTGVPLPFLSYGGTFALNLGILLSLTERVAIEEKVIVPKVEIKKVKKVENNATAN